MTSDEIHFLLVLYLIYLGESFSLPGSPAWMIYNRVFGGRRRLKSTDAALFFARRFWLLRPLVPPQGISFTLPFPRCSFGKEGMTNVSPFVGAGEAPWFLPYRAIREVKAEGRELVINGMRRLKGTPDEVRFYAETLAAAMSAPQPGEVVHEAVRRRFRAGGKARERAEGLERTVAPLSFFCGLYTFWLLAALPFALFRFSGARLFWAAGLPILVLHFLCGALFLRLYGKWVPSAAGRKWEHFFKLLLCPPMMLRAVDVVCEEAGLPGEPLSAAFCLLEKPERHPLFQRAWRRLLPRSFSKYPPPVRRALREYSALYRELVEELFRAAGKSVETLAVDPPRAGGEAFFCPCCGAGYRQGGRCPDCDGV